MEFLIVVLLVIVVFLFYKITGKISRLDKKVDFLLKEVKSSIVPERSLKPEVQEPIVEESIQEVFEEEPIFFEEKSYLVNIEDDTESNESNEELKDEAVEEYVVEESDFQNDEENAQEESPRPSFMERNPDLEKFIGENLLSKIGIVIFVIGMGFLVKLGIDNDVITESMRVAIGVVIGGGMIGLAHKLRTSYSKFSSILIGGALAVLYFSIALAFHEYQLIPQTAAFVIMVFITGFAVLLAISYDRKELAVLALIGGFGTPFFVSTGSGNIAVLFSYILILDIGMLALVYFKKWNIVNYLSYVFTYFLFFGVYANNYVGNEEATRSTVFLALTAFYLIFFLMSIIYNVKNRIKFEAIEIAMLLSNSAIYFGFGLAISYGYKNGLYNGLFTALVAVFNFGFSFILYKRKDIDNNLLFLLIGLVLTFVSLIAPIQLEGNYITLFWAVEAVLLLWLAKKGEIEIMKATSLIVFVLMLISLLMDWQNYFNISSEEYKNLGFFFNKLFITSAIAIGSIVAMLKLIREDELIQVKGISIPWKKGYVQAIFVIVLFFSFYLELRYQFVRFEFENTLIAILLGMYDFAFALSLLVYNRFNKSQVLFYINAVLSGAVILSYMSYYLFQTSAARNMMLSSSEPINTGFYLHYALLGLFVIIVVNLTKELYKKFGFKSDQGAIVLRLMAIVGVFICSVEVGHLSLLYQSGSSLSPSDAYKVAIKSVFPVVWAISALILMILGMKYQLKTLRIASLVLFSITIVKLFLYDLAGNTTGKIVSFIVLGVILLVISFLYQKLKFIIQDDHDKKND